jgi:hypothetical protein
LIHQESIMCLSYRRLRCFALCAALLACLATAQTTLDNGIVLPAGFPLVQSPTQSPRLPPYITNPPAVIAIDAGRQLFVDDFLIDSTTLTRTQHRPVMYAGNPVLSPGGPDLTNLAMPYSDGVWYDPADHLFKMWYDGGYGNDISYAYSTDGKNWTKPSFSDSVVSGSNIVMQIGGGRDSDTVWLDLQEKDPTRRYKAFAVYNVPVMNVYFSGDGIHWGPAQPNTINSLSDRTTVFWNPFRKVWVESARMMANLPASANRPAYTARARFYAESPDLLQWTPGDPSTVFWTGPDENDPPYGGQGTVPELYNLDVTPYESLLVGLFSWYYPPQSSIGASDTGPNIVELGVGFSRDGFSWVRPTRGCCDKAFIPAANNNTAWNGYNTQSAGGGFLVVGDELWFYFSGRTLQKPSNGVASTGLATLRRDGFYSMDSSGSNEGVLTTRPVLFSGSHLFVNAAAAGGQLLAEILDTNGNVIAPFSKANAIAMSADSTRQELTWSGAPNLASLAGRPVKIRFYLANGSLYSFWVTANASGASHGYVAAGGPGFTGPIDTGKARGPRPPIR